MDHTLCMSTLVCFHAHPDDEAIATGGTMLIASQAGHRVVLVLATRGEQGEPVEGVLTPGEALWERRVKESHESAEILGVHRVEFLGYKDSGMMDDPANDDPDCFWQADRGEAAARMAAILREESADVLTIYDPHGGYGHPDHIQVHRIGLAAFYAARDLGRYPLEDGEIEWAPAKLYWTAWPRSRVRAFADAQLEQGTIDKSTHERMSAAGFPDDQVTAWIDVSDRWKQKEAAWKAHRTQIP